MQCVCMCVELKVETGVFVVDVFCMIVLGVVSLKC